MSVTTGLISGIDYDAMITQLMQVEANPQTLLKQKLAASQDDADAYRAVNTKFDALRSAAEALTKTATWASAKATSTSTDVVATAATNAPAGTSVTFAVTKLAQTHSMMTAGEWSNATASAASGGPSWPLTIKDGAGKTATIELPASGTLADAAAAINAAGLGVKASVVQLAGDRFRLQFTATTGGGAGVFSVTDATGVTGAGLVTTTQGQNATLDLGNGIMATSPTNTFADLVPGVTITVTKADPGSRTTVAVSSDPEAVATAVQALVTATNAVLSSIKGHTRTTTGSDAVLKGDSTLRSLTGRVLEAISTAIGGTSSAATAGLQLNRYGEVTFDKTKFLATLQSDPKLAQRLVNGTVATTGADQVAGTTDDTAAVQGVAQRLLELSQRVTDTVSGILTQKVKSEDDEAADLQVRIEDWDRRLELRKATLTAQFTAMETMLGTLQSQSSWLSSQISSLPRWSSSDS
ncbi:flagellar hook-associated protein 2 [Geodermatophilus normandii]|uniref:Flagellar hook-associated protein 2 n=1 Tax=Geodermatophilus normandii TaxID=1137989 RepID=A0A317QC97_9ACTN|nr:flagellar filament capping protein FliD [Geodermatophilus normandii]PWW21288.1 flagellar hook-associated protein 2 [Geodermatophilus normandii]